MSHNQREASIEQQVKACRELAVRLGLDVVETYEDKAISGKSDRRPSFQRLLRDAEKGYFDCVLAWKSNRMGRNMLQAMTNEARLKDWGVRTFYAEEDFDDTAAGRFALRNMIHHPAESGFLPILLYSCCTCPFVWILCAFFHGGFPL